MNREELIQDHLGLAKEIAGSVKRGLPRHILYDDILGSAYLGLTRAARSFNETLGVPFDFYARLKIRGVIHDSLRRKNYVANFRTDQLFGDLSHIEAVSDWEIQTGEPGLRTKRRAHAVAAHQTYDPTAEIEADLDLPVLSRTCRAAIERMPTPRRRSFLTRVYRDGVTARLAGREIGIGAPAACDLHKQAITELRRVVEQSPDRKLLQEAA